MNSYTEHAAHAPEAPAAAPQAPAAPDDVLCYIRAGATLPERHGFEVCRATDTGAMAVMGDGRAHAMPTVTPAEFATDIDQLLAAPAAPAVDALDAVRQAVREYHHALDTRRHGGIAAGNAISAIQAALGMEWTQGAEAAARAAKNGGAA